MKLRVRAVVLGAGLGTRLRPLTDRRPKPLLPVLGRPLVAWTLERLAGAGVEAAAINLHHLGEQIPEALGDRYGDLPLVYSREPDILGTLGALGPLRDFLAPAEAVLIVNGDSLCSWPVRRLLAAHRRRGADATLLFTSRADPAAYGGGVALAKDRRVVTFDRSEDGDGTAVRRVFAGAQVLAPELLERVPDGFADTVRDLYRPLLASGGRLQGVVSRRAWHDLGTPERYLEGLLSWVRRPWGRSWRSPDATWEGRRLRRAVLEAGARVGAGSTLDQVLVLPGAEVGEGCRLERTVVGFDTVVPAGTEIAARLLTRASAGGTEPVGSSRVGDLLASPLVPAGRRAS